MSKRPKNDCPTWPISVILVCCQCTRKHIINTHSVAAAKRTSIRAGWMYDEWGEGHQHPANAWCPDCRPDILEDDE